MDKNELLTAVDFLIEAPEDRPFRILQITDTQVIDCAQRRFPDRIPDGHPLTDGEIYGNCFYYIEKAVRRTEPDLILFSGDITYGEFDDTGTTLTRITAYMESLGIPWAPVFGNHDNESLKGVAWQCAQFDAAPNCLFKRRELTGNGNYTVGISRGGRLIRVIYMLDSNGCGAATYYPYLPSFGRYNMTERNRPEQGFGEDQVAWVGADAARTEKTLGYAPRRFAVCHFPCIEYHRALCEKGYLPQCSGGSKQDADRYDINDPSGVDFGRCGRIAEEQFKYVYFDDPYFWKTIKAHNFDGVFCGHIHTFDYSVVYDGVRLTYGVKTGIYDYHRDDMLGGTEITLPADGDGFDVRHVFVPIP